MVDITAPGWLGYPLVEEGATFLLVRYHITDLENFNLLVRPGREQVYL